MASRKALMFALIMILPAFAGCNVKDWYNQDGWIYIDLVVQGPRNTSLDDMRSVKVAIYGVSIRQAVSTDAKHFSYGDDPLIIDVVEKGRAGEKIRLAEFKTSLLQTDTVAIRLSTFEAIDAAGNSMEICRLDKPVAKYPCFYQPDNAALIYDAKPFSPPRGGAIHVGFPVSIMYAQQGRAAEYFLYADPGAVSLELDR